VQQNRRNPIEGAPVVRFYQGMEGINTSTADLRRKARPGSTIYAMSNYDEVFRILPNVAQTSPASRLRKRLSSKVMYSYDKGEIKTDRKLLRETKKIDEPIKADIILYEDKAALMSYADQPADMTGVIIESPAIVGALRQLYERAWQNSAKK
jgi:hypothetical protein